MTLTLTNLFITDSSLKSRVKTKRSLMTSVADLSELYIGTAFHYYDDNLSEIRSYLHHPLTQRKMPRLKYHYVLVFYNFLKYLHACYLANIYTNPSRLISISMFLVFSARGAAESNHGVHRRISDLRLQSQGTSFSTDIQWRQVVLS